MHSKIILKKKFCTKASAYIIKQIAIYITICLMVCIQSSCAFFTLKNDLREMNEHSIIEGKITTPLNKCNAPYIISAFNSKNQIIKYKLIKHNSTYYVLPLPSEEVYKVAIFQDLDRNGTYSPDEPADYWLNNKSKILNNNNIIKNFTLSDKKIIPKSLQLNPNDTIKFNHDFKITVGDVSNLKTEQFSIEYGDFGLWQPFAAFRKYGVGVYFTQKYDPKKTPILFIYGMGGYAQSWLPLISRLDADKFQPWVYQYPSGYPITASAKALNIIIKQLKDKYKFKKLLIVGHSMGGLVALQFIKKIKQENPHLVKLLITVSTPWGGDKDAEWGQKAPATIPCWNDIVPDSAFIKSLSPSIFKDIPYYLLFTYKGDRKPFRINNDTTISIASQLKLEYQFKAKKVIGFNDHHAKILSDSKAISIIESIIDSY